MIHTWKYFANRGDCRRFILPLIHDSAVFESGDTGGSFFFNLKAQFSLNEQLIQIQTRANCNTQWLSGLASKRLYAGSYFGGSNIIELILNLNISANTKPTWKNALGRETGAPGGEVFGGKSTGKKSETRQPLVKMVLTVRVQKLPSQIHPG